MGFRNVDNPYGKSVKPLEGEAIAANSVKTYHGFTVVANNKVVGRVQSWNPVAYGRTLTYVKELNKATFGAIIDIVPGTHNDTTFAISRIEIWGQELELALGYGAVWEDLMDQNSPFSVQEFLFRGDTPYRIWRYAGCWFSDKTEPTMEAAGDGVYLIEGTVGYVARQKIL